MAKTIKELDITKYLFEGNDLNALAPLIQHRIVSHLLQLA